MLAATIARPSSPTQFYHDCSILKEQDTAVRCFRQLLSETVADVIKRGMSLLGIEMPNRM